MLRLVLLAMLLVLPLRQPAAELLLPELDTSSPLATYRTFLAEAARVQTMYQTYRQNPSVLGELQLGLALRRISEGLLDLSGSAPATRMRDGNFAFGYLADILHRLPEPGPEAIANLGDARRWSVPGTQIRLERIAEGPRAGEWLFSAETVARLPEFHAQVIGLPVLRPSGAPNWHEVQMRATGPLLAGLELERLPGWMQERVLGALAWKVLIAFAIVLLVAALVLAWRRVVARWTARAGPLRRRLLWLTVPAVMAALTLLAHAFIVSQLVLTGLPADAESLLATGMLYVAAAWGAWVLCWVLAEAAIASPAVPDDSFDANLLRLLARVGAPIAAGSVLFFGANDLGVPAVGLLAGVSIGGIALALAAQSTVENLFGGLSIFADRPFRVGDDIRFGGASGRVEAIGPRSTRIRGADGTLTTVPNADLAKMQVTNVSVRTRYLFGQRFSLPATIPRTRLAALLARLHERVAAHPLVELGAGAPRARLVGFTGEAVEIEVLAQLQAQTFAEFQEAQEALLLILIRAVEEIVAEHSAAPRPVPQGEPAASGHGVG
ncbi:mechanosensitive ion channel family protein [Falsiroseomonas bella]|nr:mechanosensitive ion channel domain-containing protein [Falsiroseomonas bella]